MVQLESIAKESIPSSIAEEKISVSERILYGSLAFTLAGAYMTMFKDLYDIGIGVMVAGFVICAGGLKKYIHLTKNSE